MKKGITITKYLESKQLTFEEVKKTFQLVKEIEIDSSEIKDKCIHCGDTCNQYTIPSESWTGVVQCIACGSLIFTIFSDRMSGCHTDSVFIFEQKNRPMYKLYFKCDIKKDCIECRICGNISSDKKDIEKLYCPTCKIYH